MGLFSLVASTMVKFEGLQGPQSEAATQLLESFPRVVLATFGMVDANISILGEYYGVVAFLALICLSIYAISLGTQVIKNESIDETAEFLYSKPRSRSSILVAKFLAAIVCLSIAAIVTYGASFVGISWLEDVPSQTETLNRYLLVYLVFSLIFLFMGSFFASLTYLTEKRLSLGFSIFLISYALSVIYDLSEKTSWLRYFTPFKYFLTREVVYNDWYLPTIVLSGILIVVLAAASFVVFSRKDLV